MAGEIENLRSRGRRGPKPGTGGRPKGSKNKITRSLKEMILRTLTKVGGEKYLERVATEDPKTFMGVVSRLIPSDINANVSGTLTHEVALAELAKTEE